MEEQLLIELLKKNLQLEISEESRSGRVKVTILYNRETITEDYFYLPNNLEDNLD
jgi:hypothetical protein